VKAERALRRTCPARSGTGRSEQATTTFRTAALDAMITQQAQIIAYIDDYKLLMIATVLVIPLLIAFKKARGAGGTDHGMVVE
jgi:DHA2 family multidrug resistance protein